MLSSLLILKVATTCACSVKVVLENKRKQRLHIIPHHLIILQPLSGL